MKNLFFILLFSTCASFGQFKNREDELAKKFPDEDLITLNNFEKITIEIVDKQLKISSNHQLDNIFLSAKYNAVGGLERSIGYSKYFSEISDIQATTFVPDGRKYDKIPVTEFKTEKSKSRGIFIDDSFEKSFTFKGMTKGAITSLAYKEITKDPHMLGGFLFGNYIPVENTEYSISYPANSVKLSYKSFGSMEGISFEKKEKNGQITLTWKAKDLKPLPVENESRNLRYYAPQIILMLESFEIDGKTEKIFSDVDQLFSYYNSLVVDLNKNPSESLKKLTDSLTVGKTEVEKIKSIYYWVQDNVKYVAFEEGMSGFVPRQANDVCEKRFGDCKDMGSLLTSMLKIAKIPSSLVWIGTRDIPFRYIENPTISVDNHMIAAVKLDNNWIFLDATDDKIDFGLPTTHIMGKEAMIKTGNDQYEIVMVPEVNAETNIRTDSISFKIEKNQLLGNGLSSFDGHWKGQIKHSLSGTSDKRKQEYFEDFFRLGSNKSKVENVKINDFKTRDKVFSLEYSLKIPDLARKIGKELYVNPHIFKHTNADQRIDTQKRKLSKVEEFMWSAKSYLSIEIPNGFEVDEIPKDVLFESNKFKAKITYVLNGNKIEIRQKTNFETQLVEVSDFEMHNKYVDTLLNAYNEVISFKEK